MYVFTPKRGCPICHVLLTVQNTHRRALLFIDNRHVGACVEGDGAICSKNRKIVPYHGANPNTRNGALTVSLPDYGSCVLLICWAIGKFSCSCFQDTHLLLSRF